MEGGRTLIGTKCYCTRSMFVKYQVFDVKKESSHRESCRRIGIKVRNSHSNPTGKRKNRGLHVIDKQFDFFLMFGSIVLERDMENSNHLIVKKMEMYVLYQILFSDLKILEKFPFLIFLTVNREKGWSRETMETREWKRGRAIHSQNEEKKNKKK